MNRSIFTLRSLARIAILSAALVAPMAAMSAAKVAEHPTIEAPAQAKKGLGLVLLVSLQRS